MKLSPKYIFQQIIEIIYSSKQLLKLLKYESVIERIFSIFNDKLESMSKKDLKNLFLILYDIDHTKNEFLDFFSDNFSKIDKSARNFILRSISKQNVWDDKTLKIIKENLNEIPKNILNFLLIKNHFTKKQIIDLLFFKQQGFKVLSDEIMNH